MRKKHFSLAQEQASAHAHFLRKARCLGSKVWDLGLGLKVECPGLGAEHVGSVAMVDGLGIKHRAFACFSGD